MAFQDVVQGAHSYFPTAGTRVEDLAALYTNETDLDDGEWINMAGVTSVNFVVNGISTGQVDFHAWNGATDPGVDEDGEPCYGTATSTATKVYLLTADGTISFKSWEIPRWMKVMISNSDDATIDVDMKRVRLVG